MKCILTASAISFFLAIGGGALADMLPLPAGRYEVGFRLELPHLERYAMDRTATICVDPANLPDGVSLPVFGGNAAFAGCPVTNVRREGASFKYDIVCTGRGAARAKAVYALTPGQFRGRITMVLGAKNMTMTEVQAGRRLGSCSFAGRPRK